MGAAGLVGLLLVTLQITCGNPAQKGCRAGEYLHGSHCCRLCQAGTYVAQHCSVPHARGKCSPCTRGETYTAHENGLEECLLCRQCREDQITVGPCTVTRDTECQCKQGYFCSSEVCEVCQQCSTRCPEGKEIVQNCNATMDLGCGLPGQGSKAEMIMCLVVGVVIVVAVPVLLFCGIRKLKGKKAAATDKDAEKGLNSKGSTDSSFSAEVETPVNNTANPEVENSGESPEGQVQTSANLEVKNTSPEESGVVLSEPDTNPCGHHSAKTGQNSGFHQNAQSNRRSFRRLGTLKAQEPKYRIIVEELSQKKLRKSFLTFIKEVPQEKWMQLMETHLSKNNIVKIIHEFPNDIEEQFYQMLLTWKNTLGEKQCIVKLLDELANIDTKAYNNVLDTLKSNNIISYKPQINVHDELQKCFPVSI